MKKTDAANILRETANPLTGEEKDYDALLAAVKDTPLILIGEATHGTSEFYRARAALTKRLIEEKGFKAVAVEADWPDAYRVNRYVRGMGKDKTANEALVDFRRFPQWMWRNQEVVEFVEWLRAYNERFTDEKERVGFYGLDLYSLYSSIDAVLAYLDKVDPEAADRARRRYSCFDHFGEDPQSYGYAAELGISKACEEEVLKQLEDLLERSYLYLHRDGFAAEDELFYAEQNARLVHDAERYYRAMFQRGVSTWNLRDRHMAKTLEALRKHLQQWGQRARIAVWEHNSHVGDASATEMAERGELNLGQIARSRFQHDVFIIGFTTYTGTVAAASEWGCVVEKKQVLPALAESYEDLFHQTGMPCFSVTFSASEELAAELAEPRLERAIGVVYVPHSERLSHYFHARLSRQFDAVIHFDETRAVTPMEKAAGWDKDKVPETYPYGL